MSWSVEEDTIVAGDVFVSFERTLRVPEDGNTYPLPPTFGSYPLAPAPESLRTPADVIMPMYEGEALWIAFRASGAPAAIQVETGGINAISGEPEGAALSADPQNYIVAPLQPWLDGINVGSGTVRQFTARSLGANETLGEKLHGRAESLGSLTVRLYAPRPGTIPEKAGPRESESVLIAEEEGFGLAAEGKLRQQIVPDSYGLEVWDTESAQAVRVGIVPAARWSELTGREAPGRAATPETYAQAGLPWFDDYDPTAGDVPAPRILAELPESRRAGKQVQIDPASVHEIRKDRK